MWLSNIVLLPIAAFLIYKAMNDSQLFNKEFYFRAFEIVKKLIQRIKERKREQQPTT